MKGFSQPDVEVQHRYSDFHALYKYVRRPSRAFIPLLLLSLLLSLLDLTFTCAAG